METMALKCLMRSWVQTGLIRLKRGKPRVYKSLRSEGRTAKRLTRLLL